MSRMLTQAAHQLVKDLYEVLATSDRPMEAEELLGRVTTPSYYPISTKVIASLLRAPSRGGFIQLSYGSGRNNRVRYAAVKTPAAQAAVAHINTPPPRVGRARPVPAPKPAVVTGISWMPPVSADAEPVPPDPFMEFDGGDSITYELGTGVLKIRFDGGVGLALPKHAAKRFIDFCKALQIT